MTLNAEPYINDINNTDELEIIMMADVDEPLFVNEVKSGESYKNDTSNTEEFEIIMMADVEESAPDKEENVPIEGIKMNPQIADTYNSSQDDAITGYYPPVNTSTQQQSSSTYYPPKTGYYCNSEYNRNFNDNESYHNTVFAPELPLINDQAYEREGNNILDHYWNPNWNSNEFYENTVVASELPPIIDQTSERKGYNIPNYMLHTNRKNAGFYFGKKIFWGMEYHVGKPSDNDGHILIVGGAGSGKSSRVAIPTLDTWDGVFLAIDIKSELKKHWDNINTANKPTKVFNLTKKTGGGSTYDPFYLLSQGGEDNLIQNACELAQSIIPLPHDVRDPFWIKSAQNFLTAAILYFFDIGASFNETMTSIQTTSISKLIDDINNSSNIGAKMHISQFSDITDLKMLAGIATELSNRIMVFATDFLIKDAFTPTDDAFNWEDLRTHNIFMCIAEDKLEQWGSAITLMLTQLIRTLERRPDKITPEGKELPPILLLLDEFPRLGKLDAIINAVATLRSKGVTICLMIQSLAQLDAIYGKDARRIIVDNCQYKAILNVTEANNQKYFSDLIGSIKVVDQGFSTNHHPYTSEMLGYSLQTSQSREPIIYPHEFATLKDIVLITPDGFCRVDKAPLCISSEIK